MRTYDDVPYPTVAGWFQRKVAAADFEWGKYYCLDKIWPDAYSYGIELLYTDLAEFGQGKQLREAAPTNPILVRLPENLPDQSDDWVLYCHPVRGSDTKAWMGVSEQKEAVLFAEQVTVIGLCDFASGTFSLLDSQWNGSFVIRNTATGQTSAEFRLDRLPETRGQADGNNPCLILSATVSELEIEYQSRLENGGICRQTVSLNPHSGERQLQEQAGVVCYAGNLTEGYFRFCVADQQGILMEREIWLDP